MSMLRLIPIAAAALLGGCVTGYTYHSGNGGDYYSGDARVEYRYIGPGYIGYGYSPYPYGYWGGYRGYYGGWYGGYGYGGYGGYGPGWYDPWYGYYYRGPYKPRHPGHRPPPPYTPPPVVNPGDGGGNAYVPGPSGPPRDDNGLEHPGRRYGNPPPIERPVVRMRTPTGLPPSYVRTPTQATPTPPSQVRPAPSYVRTPPSPPTYVRTSPPAPSVRPPPPTYRPAPVSVPRSTSPSPGSSERASDRARTRSGAVDTP
ncbi:MAG: hypothetical protein HOQ01_07200 [Lysobacter sp.]|nr:hypothetical protein [Lysobacter sp.]